MIKSTARYIQTLIIDFYIIIFLVQPEPETNPANDGERKPQQHPEEAAPHNPDEHRWVGGYEPVTN